nr:hypothetical protein BN887_00590 [Melanopsichium pennsylvanicum 4]
MGRRISKRRTRQPDMLPDGTMLSTCHQCRRKTPGAKMRCRRMREDDQCPLMYCERCSTIRYDIDFNPSDRNFHCPKCLGYCNCSICLRRSGFGDMISRDLDRIVALTKKLKKVAGERGSSGIESRAGDTLSETAALNVDRSTPAKRDRSGRKPAKTNSVGLDASASGPPKRRGRPPKKHEGRDVFVPVKIKLNLSDEVAEGEVFSQLEEYTLGRLSIARRVLKLAAAHQAAMSGSETSTRKLIVRLKMPSRMTSSDRPVPLANVAEEKKKLFNYQDKEKDVWVRSAADYSTSESEFDELADDESDESEPEDLAEAMFEEGHTQHFAKSLLQHKDNTSTVASRGGSPLSSLDGTLSSPSVASSQLSDDDKDSSQQVEAVEEMDTSHQGTFAAVYPQTSLCMPHNMQQLALAVLEGYGGASKAVSPDMLRLQEPSAFHPSSGSESGELTPLLDTDPGVGSLDLFAETRFSGL